MSGVRPPRRGALEQQIREGIRLREEALADLSRVEGIADAIVRAFRDGRFLYIFGNGGSAADAQHFAAELSGRYYVDRAPLPAFALTTNSSAVTAIGNDYGYEQVFERQLVAAVKPGDVVVGISTSGTSKNVLRAMEAARKAGAVTVGFCGRPEKALDKLCDLSLTVASDDVARIQEMHEVYYHLVCYLVEAELFGGAR